MTIPVPRSVVDLVRACLGLVATGDGVEERFVAATGNDTADGLTAATAYATLARALQDAPAMSVRTTLVVHLASGTYDGTVDVPSSVELRGPDTGSKPILRAAGARPVLRVGGGAKRVRSIVLRRLTVTEGKRVPGGTGGGGVMVRDADDVTIVDCEVHDNAGYRGGGISLVRCTGIRITHCRIEGNEAGTRASAVAGADFGLEIKFPIGAGHGGGVYVEDCAGVDIQRCQVAGNSAVLFGGGIAVVNTSVERAGPIDISDNEIYANETAHNDVAVLSAPASAYPRVPSMSDLVVEELEAGLDLGQARKVANVLHGAGWESGMGGGIGLKLAGRQVRITGNRIGCSADTPNQPNVARRGGGISCFTGSYPEISRNEIAYNLADDDGGGVAIDFFDPFLPPGEPDSYGVKSDTFLTRQWMTIADNDVHHNRCGGDGGGLYATGGARLAIKRVTGEATFAHNRSLDNGGGVRVSYATQLAATKVTFLENFANQRSLLRNQNPDDLMSGGGAVASRNSSVTLEQCTFTGNRVERFAGGAVFFVSCFEGGFGMTGFVSNEYHWFDGIQEASHGFHTRVLRIIDCVAQDNRALARSGAGGFLYVVRSHDKGGKEPVWILLRGAATAIGGNVSDAGPGNSFRKRGNVVIELSGKMSGALPEDRVYVSGDVPAAGIAASNATPAANPPPPEGAHRLVILPSGHPDQAASDVADPGWEYVYGPRPAPTAATPRIVAARGGTTLTVSGAGFDSGATVTLAGRPARTLSASASALRVITPALPTGPADLTVTLGSGPGITLPQAVTALPDPVITDVTPTLGTVGTPVTLTGSHFPPGALVSVLAPGAEPVPMPIVGSTGDSELRVVMPALPAGAVQVGLEVLSPSGQAAFRPFAFTYQPQR